MENQNKENNLYLMTDYFLFIILYYSILSEV